MKGKGLVALSNPSTVQSMRASQEPQNHISEPTPRASKIHSFQLTYEAFVVYLLPGGEENRY